MAKEHIEAECSACNATGLFCGFAEPKGTLKTYFKEINNAKISHGYRRWNGRQRYRS